MYMECLLCPDHCVTYKCSDDVITKHCNAQQNVILTLFVELVECTLLKFVVDGD